MKKIAILSLVIMFYITSFSQTAAQIDSINVHKQDSIISNKSSYIGQPLSKLLIDLKVNVDFSAPDNMGPKSRGQVFYKKFTVYLPWKSGAISRGFEIEIADKVYVSAAEYNSRDYEVWKNKMWILLGYSTVSAIDKFQ